MTGWLKYIFLLWFAITVTTPCDAQLFSPYNFVFKTYTTNDGLAHNSVKKCLNDSKGFLWIATENGLSRFDGYQFKNYRHIYNDSTSLAANDVNDIAIDDNDQVFAAYKTGLCMLEKHSGKFFIIRQEGKDIAAHRIAFDKKRKQLLIATTTGVLLYDIAAKKIKPTALKDQTPNVITNLYLDQQDNAWLLIQRKGYYRYHITTDTFYHYKSEDWPMSLYQDSSGVYYASTWQSGFQLFKDIKSEHKKVIHKLQPAGPGSYNSIYIGATEAPALTGNDILWVATHTNGVALFSKSQQRFVHYFTYRPAFKNGIAGSFYWGIYYDRYNNLWACGWQGLTKICPASRNFVSGELPELYTSNYNAVTGIKDDPADSNTAWIAVVGSGVAAYNKTQSKITRRWYFNEIIPDTYYLQQWAVGLFTDSNKTIWSATYGGVIKIKNGQVSFKKISDSGRYGYSATHYQSHTKNIWLAGNMLFEFNPYTDKSVRWDLLLQGNKKNYFTGVCEDGSGKIFTAAADGVYFIVPGKKETGRLYYPSSFTDSAKWVAVKSVVVIDNILYLGGSNGLAAYNLEKKSITPIGVEKGIAKVGINCLYVDKQKILWVFCSNGLFRYNPVDGNIQQFTTDDGIYIHRDDPCYFFEYNDYTYIGARMAYTRFNPRLVQSNGNVPVPHITNVTVNGISTGTLYRSSLQHDLTSNQNNISFDFTAIEYNFPEKLSFSYMLEGYDKEWSKPGVARRKSYTNLPPGNYRFKVKAFNNNGVSSAADTVISFSIEPPFWQTLWFRLMTIVLAAATILLIYRWRIKKIHKSQEEKNKLQQVQLEQYKQQLEMEQIINFFTSSLADKNTQEEVIWDVAKNLIQTLGFANCMIYLWNEDKTELLQKAGYGPNGSLETVVKEPFNSKLWQGIVGHVAATKKPIVLGDTSKDPRYRADVLNRSSELCVPALYNGELISVIDSEDFAKDYYTQQHLQILTTIATLMAARLVSIEAAEEARRKKEELAKMNEQLAQLELASLRSQMNPHFIFNSLNSIHKYIWENKPQDASEYLTKFSKLVRMILENSKEKEIVLSDEINMLHLYIELEHRRCNGKFNYSVEVDNSIDAANTAIPSMLIQPYVENAIWHGLVQKEVNGKLLVSFAAKNNMLECIVEDDGIGREKAMEIKLQKQDNHRSLGLSITGKRVDLLYSISGEAASVEVMDKKDGGGNACGTKVILLLPLNNFY